MNFYRRGLTPPHRVKSVTMSSFTPEEIEFIKSRGNEVMFQVEYMFLFGLIWMKISVLQTCLDVAL